MDRENAPDDSSRLFRLRVIFLTERLMSADHGEGLWTVAHEIAHSRLNHCGGGHPYEDECAADELAKTWGFAEPPERGTQRERFYR